MKDKEKQILIADLCARLPYGVNVIHKDDTSRKDIVTTLVGYNGHYIETFIDGLCYHLELYEFKPYLRPMSSMTKEEEEEWWEFGDKNTIVESHSYSIDWLNAHHFDYRGLIEKGLALEAPKDMYNIK